MTDPRNGKKIESKGVGDRTTVIRDDPHVIEQPKSILGPSVVATFFIVIFVSLIVSGGN